LAPSAFDVDFAEDAMAAGVRDFRVVGDGEEGDDEEDCG